MTSSVKEQMLQSIGKPKRAAFSFDTTGSMARCIEDVRNKLRELVHQMSEDIPGIQIALIAHGDYCDGDDCIRVLDFTDDVDKLISFINEAPNTSGGDAPECYELSLHEGTKLSWGDEGGTFILIGDATPHQKGEQMPVVAPRRAASISHSFCATEATYNAIDNQVPYDWKEELQKLVALKVQVFAMQCLKSSHSAQNLFWESVSQEGETPLLVLEDFGDSADVMGAAVYAAAASDEAFEKYSEKARTYKTRSRTASLNVADNLGKLASYRNKTE